MKRAPQKRTAASKPRSARKSKKAKATPGKILKYSFLFLLGAFVIAAGYQYRHGFLYYLGFKTNKHIESLSKKEGKLSDVRMYEIVSRHKNKVFGIDVSHYQGTIEWDSVKASNKNFPIHFVFVRATAGDDGVDTKFKANWKQARANGFICGAYHYYRPNENSVKQAENFIKTVKLSGGDLPPVLDIEQIPSEQSMDSLKSGLKRWIAKVEKHYGMKPILYSGESFYTDFLREEFKGYKLWIANYSFFVDEIRPEWHFWQFTDKASVSGIEGNVDVNIYNGDLRGLKGTAKK
ncbi:MAG: glycoside hydrolase family 25 protein [Flavobacterium sp.]|nr:MAG: glycoside hydrolase family 25 protein [Flavobacterium sp.]